MPNKRQSDKEEATNCLRSSATEVQFFDPVKISIKVWHTTFVTEKVPCYLATLQVTLDLNINVKFADPFLDKSFLPAVNDLSPWTDRNDHIKQQRCRTLDLRLEIARVHPVYDPSTFYQYHRPCTVSALPLILHIDHAQAGGKGRTNKA
ncbi:hypothetical protein J6590_055278 [Homalodisca vitripennis]|nr:hypothetical protein J6590_055278 [Homalodisca vitripennis]